MSAKWPLTAMSDLLTERQEVPDLDALLAGDIRIVAKIGFADGQIELRRRGETKTDMILIRPGDLVVSGINAAKGAIGYYSKASTQPIAATIHYGAFIPNETLMDPKYLWHFMRSGEFRELLVRELPQGIKTELKASRLLPLRIALPPLPEQRRIVARLEEFGAKIEQARSAHLDVDRGLGNLLHSVHQRISEGAARKPVSEVAPLQRRPASVDPEVTYPQISVRSFGKGVFHQPAMRGSEITWQKPFRVRAGDILISNIKAWEGAVAVVPSSDDGRFGSHRYLTCVPVEGVATAGFVCFHLLTREGLHQLGEASPGSADRNRTLNTNSLLKIPVPVPPIEQQRWFDKLLAKAEEIREQQGQRDRELDALLPSILDKAFRGEL